MTPLRLGLVLQQQEHANFVVGWQRVGRYSPGRAGPCVQPAGGQLLPQPAAQPSRQSVPRDHHRSAGHLSQPDGAHPGRRPGPHRLHLAPAGRIPQRVLPAQSRPGKPTDNFMGFNLYSFQMSKEN